jgi:hypothetical protein
VPPTKAEVLAAIEARYLTEYVAFAGQIREYVSDTLSKAFRADPNSIRRSHHVVQLVQLEYAAYEDAAALLKALLLVEQAKAATILETLESYRPGDAVLATVLQSAGASTPEQLYDLLHLEEAIPKRWHDWFPNADLRKAFLLACRFFIYDCCDNQKQLGVAAYNKSKHGPLVVSRGDLLGPSLAPVPSMFFANRWPDKYGPNPMVVYGFPSADENIEERERCIHFVQRSLRLIVAAVIGRKHVSEVLVRWGSIEGMWRSYELRDVIELVEEINRRDGASPAT